MRTGALLDRLYESMRAEERPWRAGEIAERVLRLRSPGAAAEHLVDRLLRDDPRFVREGGPGEVVYSALASTEPPLAARRRVLAWIWTGAKDPSEWRAHFAELDGGARTVDARGDAHAGDPRTADARGDAHAVDPRTADARGDSHAGDPRTGDRSAGRPFLLAGADASRWEEARARYADAVFLTTQPAALLRLCRWAERRFAFDEWEPSSIDLTAWASLQLHAEGLDLAQAREEARLPRLTRRWGIAHQVGTADDGAQAALTVLRQVAERLLDAAPATSVSELQQALEAKLGTRPIAWERFEFDARTLDATPQASGVYRFFGDDDRLLYVGKAVDLSRRLASYFRPLPPESSKREQLLEQIRRFEYELVGSELEALVREARAIREEGPTWNVQIRVHAPEWRPRDHEWPLLFLPPGRGGLRSFFALLAPDAGWLVRLPAEIGSELEAGLADWTDRLFLRCAGDPAVDVEPPADLARMQLVEEEVSLALRYHHRSRDQLEGYGSVRYGSGREVLAALQRS